MPELSQAFKQRRPRYQFPITWQKNTFFIQNDFRVLCAGLTMRASSKKTGVRSVAAHPGGLLQSPGQVICQKPLPTLGGWEPNTALSILRREMAYS